VDPLVIHDDLASRLFFTSAGAWGVGELVLAIRARPKGGSADRSQLPLFATTTASFLGAVAIAQGGVGPVLPGGGWWPVAVGLAIFWGSVAFRAWAIRTLGRYFMCVVVIQESHEVIDTGPYSRIRHPSYLGLIGALLGLGIALDNWIGIAICVIPPAVGFSLRLLSEERTLARELGEPYRAYMRRTDRLIPGVW
jgi:protein-S-isoprenylcysteine O-methyltransferase Ste14